MKILKLLAVFCLAWISSWAQSAIVWMSPSLMAPVSDRSILGLVNEGNDLVYALHVGVGRGNVVYLVRAIGPTLKTMGIENALAQPQIYIERNGKEFAFVSGWSNLVTTVPKYLEKMRQAEATAGAFPLSVGSLDSAMIVSLPEGTYTINVRPASGGASPSKEGKVLLQIYELPQLAVENSPPSLPQLTVSSPKAFTGFSWEFALTSTDVDHDDIDFLIDWNDDGGVDEVVKSSGANVLTLVRRTWSHSGTYYVRVCARDGRGAIISNGLGIRFAVTVVNREE